MHIFKQRIKKWLNLGSNNSLWFVLTRVECGASLFSYCPVSAAAGMGQQISGQVVNRLPEKVVKHMGLVRDSGYVTYEEFLARVAELNDV